MCINHISASPVTVLTFLFVLGALLVFCFVLFCFETGSYYVAVAGLELTVDHSGLGLTDIYLPLPPEYWKYICFFCFVLWFLRQCHYEALVDHKLTMKTRTALNSTKISLPLPPECWDLSSHLSIHVCLEVVVFNMLEKCFSG